ncbi:MAG TPA: hypothetical protein VFP69_17925 [Streptomyces sp.]|jgi:hypothetical protein|nr:hypothetical protein [Streptomyces sp.]
MSAPGHPSEGPRAAGPHPSGRRPDTVSDVARWAAFTCVFAPVVLLWYGTSLAGAAGTALGLAAVTSACRVLLGRSERGARKDSRHTEGRTPAG